MPSAIDLKRLRKLASAATPGPWTYTKMGSVVFGEVVEDEKWSTTIEKGGGTLIDEPGMDSKKADLRFIAAANPVTMLTLLDALDVMREGLGYYAGNFDGRDGTKWINGHLVEEDKFGNASRGRPDIARQALARADKLLGGG